MLNNDLFEKLGKLETVSGCDSFKVNYAVAKNIKKLKEEVELVREQIAKIDKCTEYYTKRGIIEQEIREATEETKEAKIQEFVDLNKEYSEVVTKIEEVLNSETDFKFYKIKLSDCPEKLSKQNTEILFDLIEE